MAVWNANLFWLVAFLWGLAHRFRSTAQLASPPLMSAHVLGGLIDGSGTHDQISHPGLSVRNCTTGPTSAHLLINRCGQMFCDLETHCCDSCISKRSAHCLSLQTSLNRATCGTRTGRLLCVIKIIRLKVQSDLTPGFQKNYNNGVIFTDSSLIAI